MLMDVESQTKIAFAWSLIVDLKPDEDGWQECIDEACRTLASMLPDKESQVREATGV